MYIHSMYVRPWLLSFFLSFMFSSIFKQIQYFWQRKCSMLSLPVWVWILIPKPGWRPPEFFRAPTGPSVGNLHPCHKQTFLKSKVSILITSSAKYPFCSQRINERLSLQLSLTSVRRGAWNLDLLDPLTAWIVEVRICDAHAGNAGNAYERWSDGVKAWKGRNRTRRM